MKKKALNSSRMSRSRNRRFILDNTTVELRQRTSKRWACPRNEVFLAGGPFSSGMVWKVGHKWASTEGPTFDSMRAALRSLISLCTGGTSKARPVSFPVK